MSAEDTRDHNKRDRLLLTVKRDDDYPTIEATLTDADGEVIDLSDTGISTIEIHADHVETGTPVINSTATVVDAPAGTVEYALSATETAREGLHNLEFVIQYTDGRTRTVPQSGYYYLDVDRPVSRGQLDPGAVDGSTSLSVGYLTADEAVIGTLSVTNAPVDADDAVRKAEHDTKADQTAVDSLSTTVGTKADKNGLGTATLSNYASIGTAELHSDEIVVGGRSIQSAVDAAPIGGRVYVSADYDFATETLPISITKPLRISGVSPFDSVIDASGVSASDVFAIDLSGATASAGDSVVIENIGIAGGNNQIDLSNTTDGRFKNLVLLGANNSGVNIRNSTNSQQSNHFEDVYCRGSGSVGIFSASGSKAHGTQFRGCHAIDCGAYGARFNGGVGIEITGGSYEKNTAQGIRSDTESTTVRGAYIENNDSASNNSDISLTGEGGRILGCRFNGLGTNARGVVINNTGGAIIANNRFRGYSNGLVVLFGGADNDISASTNRSLDGSPVLGSDGATRTRSGGVIGGGPLGGVDIGLTTGQFVGDEAMSNGTTGTAYLHARWTGTGWQLSDGSAVI